MPSAGPISPLRLAFTGLYLLFWPALMFVLAGTLRWRQGWVFAVWFVVLCTVAIGWLYRNNPALLLERYRAPGTGGQSPTDKRVVQGLGLLFTAWIVLPPLDTVRFHWTHLPTGLQAPGQVLLLGSAFFLFRSFTDNTFLSPLVRVQEERQHTVVTTGVYGLVRHPMYLGGSLMMWGQPLLLGSALTLLIAAALTALLVFRIKLEERTLVDSLPGYAEYRQQVRYRLVPFVW